jgi:uncharacterized protein
MGATSISCHGCGACCERVGYPPFYRTNPGENQQFAALERSHPELAAEMRQAAVDRRRELGLPCSWLDPETKRCQHYELRPQICRDFELGSPKCLELRWLKWIE